MMAASSEIAAKRIKGCFPNAKKRVNGAAFLFCAFFNKLRFFWMNLRGIDAIDRNKDTNRNRGE